jgi:intracellular septation protein
MFLLIGIFLKKAFLKNLFVALFDMKDRGWYILTLRWGIFLVLLAIGNELVWRGLDRDAWVSYKFWSTIATVVFGFYQITLSKKYRNDTASPWGMRTKPYHAKNVLE